MNLIDNKNDQGSIDADASKDNRIPSMVEVDEQITEEEYEQSLSTISD